MDINDVDDLMENAFKPPKKASLWTDLKLYIKALLYSGIVYTFGIYLITVVLFFALRRPNFWQYQINVASFFFIVGFSAKTLKMFGRYSSLIGISTIISWTNTAGGAERGRRTLEAAMEDFRKSMELVGWDVSFIFAGAVLVGISLLIIL